MASFCKHSNFLYITFVIAMSGWFQIALTRDAPYSSIFSPACEYTLPALPYPLDGLEPFIDAATLKVHHQGHHKSYTTKLNVAVDDLLPDCHESNPSLYHILTHLEEIPFEDRRAIVNNGGGFVNHNIYWAVMSPNPSKKERLPDGTIAGDISDSFGSYEAFKEEFTAKALALFGSGYVWLSRKVDNTTKGSSLVVTTTANQDSPISDGLRPILVIDVWEHAYYLKHQNLRPKYVADWWKVVDWNAVAKLDKWWQTELKQSTKHDEL